MAPDRHDQTIERKNGPSGVILHYYIVLTTNEPAGGLSWKRPMTIGRHLRGTRCVRL